MVQRTIDFLFDDRLRIYEFLQDLPLLQVPLALCLALYPRNVRLISLEARGQHYWCDAVPSNQIPRDDYHFPCSNRRTFRFSYTLPRIELILGAVDAFQIPVDWCLCSSHAPAVRCTPPDSSDLFHNNFSALRLDCGM